MVPPSVSHRAAKAPAPQASKQVQCSAVARSGWGRHRAVRPSLPQAVCPVPISAALCAPHRHRTERVWSAGPRGCVHPHPHRHRHPHCTLHTHTARCTLHRDAPCHSTARVATQAPTAPSSTPAATGTMRSCVTWCVHFTALHCITARGGAGAGARAARLHDARAGCLLWPRLWVGWRAGGWLGTSGPASSKCAAVVQ